MKKVYIIKSFDNKLEFDKQVSNIDAIFENKELALSYLETQKKFFSDINDRETQWLFYMDEMRLMDESYKFYKGTE